ncbi:late expression factor-4 [Helicoverpa armigera granulovirus]|uniref:Late expression factor-4 n=1 Tax=Helicoverpa armigera granulovirus TaxID=489830 RepID=A9YMV4_9BBAC|nr:late expression factor-4 [Helicoverpa armigera granulovirus]ABY47803.1 late expression factor-4 [Helicoverpa armigera granulovirus]
MDNKNNDSKICHDEYEMSYTLTLPQDLLYKIKQYLDKHFFNKERYVEIIDVNHTRTRLQDSKLESVTKRLVDSNKIVVLCGDVFVPLFDRHCVETCAKTCSSKIRRLCKVLVYNFDDIEIKFEHIYFEYNDGDLLDPLMATKQIALHNLLVDDKPLDVTNNSHLGSDEILANCRIEMEYESAGNPNQAALHKMAELIAHLENSVIDVKIEPFIQHTSVLNEIQLRSFVDEVDTISVHENDYAYWAIKLDGVRGRGYVINGGRIHLQLDDMRLFAGDLSVTMGANKILCVQVEYIESCKTFYVTDVVSVYKFLYDNRNQFEKSSPYPITLQQAIQFLTTYTDKRVSFCHNNDKYTIRFQTYDTARSKLITEADVPNDGFVAVTRSGELHKIKDHRTVEMVYVRDGTFECSFGVYKNVEASNLELNQIYEVIMVDDNHVRVVKHRKDRIVPN